ncbi:hypothetical protein FAZ78_18755 [Cereibacter changlensis]|uniref:DUF1636 domain-containing protein n=1 Tax=Cereibacter changlensis TaxID=402884 RepID=A0A4U0YW90_9RHOB|nr:hypothetical protein [Cereibacter changlensis]TKA95079.1 hypothetical protein FAZ78_18755 [Cereibacter changlensis]
MTTSERTYLSTRCRHTGEPCHIGLAVVRQLAASVEKAGPLLAPEFEMQGHVRLEGCSRPCSALFRMTPGDLQVFCDLDPSDWSPGLLRLAELLTGDRPAAADRMPGQPPAAVVLATRREPPRMTAH